MATTYETGDPIDGEYSELVAEINDLCLAEDVELQLIRLADR